MTIKSKPASAAYRCNYDSVFKKCDRWERVEAGTYQDDRGRVIQKDLLSWYYIGQFNRLSGPYKTLKEAKKAAERDYERSR